MTRSKQSVFLLYTMIMSPGQWDSLYTNLWHLQYRTQWGCHHVEDPLQNLHLDLMIVNVCSLTFELTASNLSVLLYCVSSYCYLVFQLCCLVPGSRWWRVNIFGGNCTFVLLVWLPHQWNSCSVYVEDG